MVKIEIQYYTDQDYAFDLLDNDSNYLEVFKTNEDLFINHDLTYFEDEDGMNVIIRAHFEDTQHQEMIDFFKFCFDHTRGRVKNREFSCCYEAFAAMFDEAKTYITTNQHTMLAPGTAKVIDFFGDGNWSGTRIIILEK